MTRQAMKNYRGLVTVLGIVVAPLALAAGIHGLWDIYPPNGCPDFDAQSLAVLEIVQKRLGDVPNGYLYDGSKDALLHQKSAVADVTAWAGTIKDHCVRSIYLNWMNYYDNHIDDALEEATTHKHAIETDKYRGKMDARIKAAHEIAPNIEHPPQ